MSRARALLAFVFFFFQAEDGIRDVAVTGVQTCALPIFDFDVSLASEHELATARRQAITRRCERAQARIIAQVFHRYGKPIKSLRRAWMTACREAGRPGLLLHDLRRSAVRNLERAGISRSVAMKLTGHKTEAGVPALRDRR